MEGVGELVGREHELEALRTFLADTDGEGPSALLVEGPAGIGKTSLWEAGLEVARDQGTLVLVARPAHEEAAYGFSALADLLSDVDIGALPGLAEPQRRALEGALLLGRIDSVTDALAVPAALLSTLRLLAQTAPVVVAVDDVQWLDPPSESALAYAGRRLRPGQARFVLTRRLPDGARSRLEHALAPRVVEVAPLSFGGICRVLAAQLGMTLTRSTSRRLYDASGGNPLFALELGRLIAARGGRLPATGELPLPDAVESALADRLETMPAAVRRALLAAELGGNATAAELAAAADLDDVEEAERAGVLVRRDDRVRPSHPLLGAAARSRTSPAEVRKIRLALARTAEDEERAVRHLALASRGPDLELAARVADAAGRAEGRGAASSAAELGEHALRLTPPGDPAWPARLLATAEYQNAAGELERVRDLLVPSVDALPSAELRVRALVLLRTVAQSWTESSRHLDRAVEEAQAHPALRALTLCHLAAHAAIADVRGIPQSLAHAEEAASLAESGGGAALRLEALGTLAWVRHLAGLASDDVRERCVGLLDASGRLYTGPERAFAIRRIWRGELATARRELARLLALSDARGETEAHFTFRLHLCELELRAGRWDRVDAFIEEWAGQQEEAIGGAAALARCRTQLATGRGHFAEAKRLAVEAFAAASRVETRWQTLETRRALGLAELGDGDAGASADALRQVWRHTLAEGVLDPGAFPAAPDLVEALVTAGEHGEARAVMEELVARGESQDHPWAAAAGLRARGLVLLGEGDGAGAAEQLAHAAASLGELGFAFDRARTLASLGVALRRERRVREGRGALEEAVAIFDELGSSGWSERARSELARFGGRRSSSGLTPMETRVAELVARGSSNKRVAAELTVSVNAVERHLTRIYRKLDVRSRSELAVRLAIAAQPAAISSFGNDVRSSRPPSPTTARSSIRTPPTPGR